MEEYSGGVQRAKAVSGGMTTMDDEIISTRDTHNHPSDAAELQAEKITTTRRVCFRCICTH